MHPGLADRYHVQVTDLTTALQSDSTKAEAKLIIRSLLTEIRLIPQYGIRPVKARFQAFSVSQFHGMSSSRRFIL
jgi:hypothetical protein